MARSTLSSVMEVRKLTSRRRRPSSISVTGPSLLVHSSTAPGSARVRSLRNNLNDGKLFSDSDERTPSDGTNAGRAGDAGVLSPGRWTHESGGRLDSGLYGVFRAAARA